MNNLKIKLEKSSYVDAGNVKASAAQVEELLNMFGEFQSREVTHEQTVGALEARANSLGKELAQTKEALGDYQDVFKNSKAKVEEIKKECNAEKLQIESETNAKIVAIKQETQNKLQEKDKENIERLNENAVKSEAKIKEIQVKAAANIKEAEDKAQSKIKEVEDRAEAEIKAAKEASQKVKDQSILKVNEIETKYSDLSEKYVSMEGKLMQMTRQCEQVNDKKDYEVLSHKLKSAVSFLSAYALPQLVLDNPQMVFNVFNSFISSQHLASNVNLLTKVAAGVAGIVGYTVLPYVIVPVVCCAVEILKGFDEAIRLFLANCVKSVKELGLPKVLILMTLSLIAIAYQYRELIMIFLNAQSTNTNPEATQIAVKPEVQTDNIPVPTQVSVQPESTPPVQV